MKISVHVTKQELANCVVEFNTDQAAQFVRDITNTDQNHLVVKFAEALVSGVESERCMAFCRQHEVPMFSIPTANLEWAKLIVEMPGLFFESSLLDAIKASPSDFTICVEQTFMIDIQKLLKNV